MSNRKWLGVRKDENYKRNNNDKKRNGNKPTLIVDR